MFHVKHRAKIIRKVGIHVDIMNVITNMGFPIACCIFMFKYGGSFIKELIEKISDTNRENADTIAKMNTAHSEEMKMFADAINNNTKAVIELREYLRGVSDGREEDRAE